MSNLDLGPYANDPRITEVIDDETRGQAVAVDGGRAWRSKRGDAWWAESDRIVMEPRGFSTPSRALQFLLDEPRGDGSVGQQWEDLGYELPDGHRSIVTVTGVYHLISGWSCTVNRREVDADGKTVQGAPVGEGSIYLDLLLDGYRQVEG
jgi:hypothetical protein